MKLHFTGAYYAIMTGLCICIIIIIPNSASGRIILESSCRIQIKQPERYINRLDLLNMIFIFEHPGQKRFLFVVLLKRLYCFFFGFFKRDHIIRTIGICKLLRHDHRIITVRTNSCTCCLFRKHLSSAGRTAPHRHV